MSRPRMDDWSDAYDYMDALEREIERLRAPMGDIEELARHLCKQVGGCDPDEKVSTLVPWRGPKTSIIVRDTMLVPAWHLYVTEAVAVIEWMDLAMTKHRK